MHRPRRPRLIAAVLLCAVMLASAAHADITVHATLSPSRVAAGESAMLAIDISGAQDAPPPAIGGIKGVDVRYLGPSTQVSIVNGRMSASVQHRYSVLSMQPGRYTLGPFTVEYGGKQYQTQSFALEVTAAGQAPGQARAPGQADTGAAPSSSALRLTVSVPDQRVYLHQRVPLDVTLYVGAIRVADVQYPTLGGEGLSLEKFPEPTQRQQVIDGQQYQVLHFQTTIVPMQAGTLTLGPASLQLSLLSKRRGMGFNDHFFQQFFDEDPFMERRPYQVRSDPVTLTVLPLPEDGKPADFSGAVGAFAMQVTASPTEVATGDPITLRIAITGSGNLTDATAPALASTDRFRIYEPHAAKSETGGGGSLSVARSYEQVLMPTTADVHTLPLVHFTYFNPQTARYDTLSSAPIPVTVRAPQGPSQAEVVAGAAAPRAAEPDEKLGHDIIYIKDDPGRLSGRGDAVYRRAVFWLWQPIPLLLFAGSVWYDRRRTRLRGDVRYARFSRAGRVARDGMATAERALHGGNARGFYDTLSQTLQEYLAAKLDLPPGAVEIDAVARCGLPTEEVECVRRIFSSCEQARFAPVAANGDMRGTLDLAQAVVRRLERSRSLLARVNGRRAGAAMLALAVVIAARGQAVPPSPQTTFFRANALYKDGQYTAAAQEYEQVLAAGMHSANLYFNLANAYFKAGDKGRAILDYERARRLAPSDPDIHANLEYARSLTGAEACPQPWWRPLVFPAAERMATESLAVWCSAVYTLLLALAIAYRLVPARPRWLLYGAGGTAVLLLALLMSLAAQVGAGEGEPAVIIIRAGETAARFEPSDNGTVHFTLKEGVLVRVRDRRDPWLEIERCDGRRGWIAQDTAAAL